MSHTPCLAFKNTMTVALASAGPIEIAAEPIRHAAGCASCQHWLDGQALVPPGLAEDAAIARLAPLQAAADAAERAMRSSVTL